MKMIRSISGIVFAILGLIGIIGLPSRIQAQALGGGEFKLSHSVHWGNAVLPTGNFIYSIEAGAGATIVRVQQIGGSFTGLFLPRTQSEATGPGSKGIVLVRNGEEIFVTSLRVAEAGLMLNFSPPNPGTDGSFHGPTETRYISGTKDPALGYFTIFNPRNEKIPYAEAERVYLAACETIEREFNRSTPIRPRLTVLLGNNENNLLYPNRELRLARWDKNRFAEAVVELVLHDMISAEDRLRLTKQAVTHAGATVGLCELKDCAD